MSPQEITDKGKNTGILNKSAKTVGQAFQIGTWSEVLDPKIAQILDAIFGHDPDMGFSGIQVQVYRQQKHNMTRDKARMPLSYNVLNESINT